MTPYFLSKASKKTLTGKVARPLFEKTINLCEQEELDPFLSYICKEQQ